MTEKLTERRPDSTHALLLLSRLSTHPEKPTGKRLRKKTHQAAARIARAWRCHVFTRAYRAARDLLLRCGGVVATRRGTSMDTFPADIIHDAPLALRLANPAEAALANDRGACVHVRLRLGAPHRPRYLSDIGGDAFSIAKTTVPNAETRLGREPGRVVAKTRNDGRDAESTTRSPAAAAPPSVYYRVYTHHPVADLNALSPEAYFEDAKRHAEAYARSKRHAACPEDARKATRASANAYASSVRYARLDANDWRPWPPRAARALAEDERISAEVALGALGFCDSRRRANGFAAALSSRAPGSARAVNRGARGWQRRERTSASGASHGRRAARVTNRGARTDAAVTCAVLQRRARAWSAGGDESLPGSKTIACSEYDEDSEDVDSAEDVDSLLEWSAGLDFEAFDVSWSEAFHGAGREKSERCE